MQSLELEVEISPISQWSPVQPLGHLQIKDPGRFSQVPPFLQRFTLHSSISETEHKQGLYR